MPLPSPPPGAACWKGCHFIGNPDIDEAAAPFFSKSFTLQSACTQGVVHLCGVGYHELYLNGQKADGRLLAPPQSIYDKTVYYASYDLTTLATQGENRLVVLLGNGLYNGFDAMAWYWDTAHWRDRPKMLLYGRFGQAGGDAAELFSGPGFKTGESRTTYNMLYGGETQDFTRPDPVTQQMDAKPATIVKGPGGLLRPFAPPYVVERGSFEPQTVHTLPDGRTVYDFGQNMAGWVRVSAAAQGHTRFTLRHAEILDGAGELDISQIGAFGKTGRFQTDEYILDAEHPIENARPHFVYHGFRYVELAVQEGTLDRIQLTAVPVHTDLKDIGKFSCSSQDVNRLFHLARWSTLSNVVNIPTDCPQREKNGWTGDPAMSVDQMCLQYDMTAAFRRWLGDIRDTQRPSGQLPGIVPSGWFGYNWGCGPVWDSVLFVLPHAVWRYQGDGSLMRENYRAMVRYLDFCQSMAQGHILNFGLGDWCPPTGHEADHKCPVRVSDTATYYMLAQIAVAAAGLCGLDGEQAAWTSLASEIRQAFLDTFVDAATGAVEGKCQTSQAMALCLGLVEGGLTRKAGERLVEYVNGTGGYLDFGILGSKYVFEALSRCGHGQLAYDMAMKDGFPSYKHWLDAGETTMPERWQNASSRNHHMFSDICRWFFQCVAGLNPPNFTAKTVLFTPDFPSQLDHAEAETETPAGTFGCGWRRVGDNIELGYRLPEGFTAQVEPLGAYAARQAQDGRYILTSI